MLIQLDTTVAYIGVSYILTNVLIKKKTPHFDVLMLFTVDLGKLYNKFSF